MTTPVPVLERSEVIGRPRYEGSNIGTWIGFKHVMYLVEEAVLEHLRQSGLAPRQLYEERGLGVEIVDSDARIATALHMDDEVRTEVLARPTGAEDTLVFDTATFVERPTGTVKAATTTLRVTLREPVAAGPARTALELPVLSGRGQVGVDDEIAALIGDSNAIVWRWRIPYFYCHFSRHLQHSGYLRLMEEVVDIFLAERGISIRTMLDGQRWIPVVPRARVQLLTDALMEEEIYTVFVVEEIFKEFTYTARMDCYVKRGGELVQTATGRITHGYAEVLDRCRWKLVPFDARTMAALRRKDRTA